MRQIYSFAILLLISLTASSQDYIWATNTAKVERTKPNIIKHDDNDNVYLATNTGVSKSSITSSRIEKRDASNQQVLWSISGGANSFFSDIEFNNGNNIVIGYFKGSITLNGTTYSSSYYTGFIFECDANGTFNWVKIINPFNAEFKPVDLFIANNQLYITADVFSGNTRASFHALDLQGNIIKSEIPTRADNATYSNIIVDNNGNVYLSGCCGSQARFDALSSHPTQSYQNFIVKYDSNFNALSLVTKNYITFDHENKLHFDGTNIYWTYHYTDPANSAIRDLKTDVLNSNLQTTAGYSMPIGNAFFPIYDFKMNKDCSKAVFAYAAFQSIFISYFDNSFNTLFKDTLAINTAPSVGSLQMQHHSTDSSFYISAPFYNNALNFNGITITNPNLSANFPYDIFIAKWKKITILPISEIQFTAAKLNDKAHLIWKTKNEINTNHFEIEQSFDSKKFEKIDELKAVGKGENSYNKLLAFDQQKTTYYRIKVVDNDGKFTYSETKTLNFKPQTLNFNIYPNPSTNLINVSYTSTQQNSDILLVKDMLGKTVQQQKLTTQIGSNNVQIDISNLSAGQYFICVNQTSTPFIKD